MEDFISTRASHSKGSYISVSYKNPKKKAKLTDDLVNEQKLQKNNKIDSAVQRNSAELKREQEKEMKKARYDVIKFGMSGFEKGKARKTKVELAISLGAIAPKNKRINYKELKARRKMNEAKIEKKEHTSGFTSSLLKPKFKKKVDKKDFGILGVYGKVPKSALQKS